MQHGLVADRHALPHGQREARVGMQHRAFLHVTVLADADRFVVPAQHRLRPYADTLFEGNVTDHAGIVGHEGFRVQGRYKRVVLVDRHFNPPQAASSVFSTPAAHSSAMC
ncbi:hypothetical protein D3C76_1243890 [compost metagenome]